MRQYDLLVLVALIAVLAGIVWLQRDWGDLYATGSSVDMPDKEYPWRLHYPSYLELNRQINVQQKLLKQKEAEVGASHLDLVPLIKQLAITYCDRGNVALAEQYYRRSLALLKEHLPPDAPELATAYREIGEFYKYLYRDATAALYYLPHYVIADIDKASDSLQLVPLLIGRADVHRKTEDFTKAEKDYRRAITILFSRSGSGDRGLVEPLTKLARMYQTQKQYRKAFPLYRQALRIQKAIPTINDADTIRLMESTGWILEKLGRFDEAEQMYKRAMDFGMETSYPALNSFNALMRLYGEQDRVEAAKALHKSIDILLDPQRDATESFLKKQIDAALQKALKDWEAEK